MIGRWGVAGAMLAISSASLAAQGGVPPRADSAFARARALVTEGNGAAGRTLVDSVLQTSASGTPTYVEALWWRAVLAEQAAAAERDLLRLAIEYSASPRAPEALLRLGQLELARGAREAAARHFERLVSEHPDSPLLAQGYFGKGRALLDTPRAAEGCTALAAARSRVTAAQVELRNQIEFAAQRCASGEIGAAPPAPPVPTPTPAPTRAATPPREPERPAASASSGPLFSVAAGTYPTRDKAIAQLRLVERAGFDGRVGLAGPGKYRVFVGERLPKAEAQALQQRLTRAKVKGVTLLAAQP